MALGLTQGALDRFAEQMIALLPTEVLAYKATGTVGAATTPCVGHWGDYSQRDKALLPMLVNARRLRVPASQLPTAPQRKAVVIRPGGDVWEIQTVDGGLGRAFWFLACVHVG